MLLQIARALLSIILLNLGRDASVEKDFLVESAFGVLSAVSPCDLQPKGFGHRPGGGHRPRGHLQLTLSSWTWDYMDQVCNTLPSPQHAPPRPQATYDCMGTAASGRNCVASPGVSVAIGLYNHLELTLSRTCEAIPPERDKILEKRPCEG